MRKNSPKSIGGLLPRGYHPTPRRTDMAPSVGFIGVGNMGNPMAGNVLKAGFPMTVFDKNPGAMANLLQAGAQKAASAQEVVERSEIVMTCLPASPHVEALYLEPGGLVERARPGTILIDLSSVLPSTPRKIEPRAKARGVEFLEAPVSGGVSGARAATLAVMVGGDPQVLERARPVVRAIGPNIFGVGPVGAGNTVKAINNMMACVNSLAMMEGLVLGRKAGLDPMTIYEVVKASSGGSKALERIPTAIVPRNFAPGFKVFLMNKDLETFNTIAKELHVPVSFSNVAQRYQQAAMAAGLVDAHSHARALSPSQKGVLNDYLENNLIDWTCMPVFEPELTAALGAWRHLRSGCTTIHHMGFDTDGPQARGRCETAIRTYLEAGIRLAFAPGVRNVDKLVLDSKAFLATLPPELKAFAEPLVHIDSERVEDEYFALFDHLHGRFASEDTRVLLSPSWAQACTERFLLRAKTTADQLGKVPIHMHCVQTPIQKAFSFRKYGKSAIAWLDDLGLVDENLTLGHAIWVTEEDIERLATRRASITSHPSCNLGMRNGLAPIYVMHRRGVNVAMGLDDKTINDDEDAVMELRMLHKLHRVPDYDLTTPPLDAYDVLRMGTLNGARAVGFGGQIGALKAGMKADMILVNLDRVLRDPWMIDDLPIAEAFVHRAMGEDVDTAIVGGRVVMQDRRLTTLDVDALYREIRKAARAIGPRQRRHAEGRRKLKPYVQDWYNAWLTPDAVTPFYVLNSRR